MAYCEWQDVTDITGSGLSSTIGDRLIEAADAIIDSQLEAGGLSAITGTVPSQVEYASAYFAAAMVARRPDAMDNAITIKLPGYEIQRRLSRDAAAEFEAIARKYLEEYIEYNSVYSPMSLTEDDEEGSTIYILGST